MLELVRLRLDLMNLRVSSNQKDSMILEPSCATETWWRQGGNLRVTPVSFVLTGVANLDSHCSSRSLKHWLCCQKWTDQPSALQHIARFWEILPVTKWSNPDALFAEDLAFYIEEPHTGLNTNPMEIKGIWDTSLCFLQAVVSGLHRLPVACTALACFRLLFNSLSPTRVLMVKG